MLAKQQKVPDSSTRHNPVLLHDCVEHWANPKTISLEWETNKCLIQTHSEEIASNP